MIQILVVEDDSKLNYIVSCALREAGYLTSSCKNGTEAFDYMQENPVHLIVSDIMMPDMDGYELAREVRRLDEKIPILFMTARDDFASKQKGFLLGIDDYMVKPIDMDEMLLRIAALLRRADISSQKMLRVGSLCLNEEETCAYIGEEEITLTLREFQILFKLLSYPKKTFTRMQLMDEFWGYDSESSPRTVDVSITKLREKIADCEEVEIQTVRGLGYKAVIR